MSRSIIKYFLLCVVGFCYAQDSIPKYKERYSLRLGIDMSKPIRMMIEENYKGLEFTADYRLTYNLYLASEMGMEEKHVISEVLDFQTSGRYAKIGVDINVFKNWQGMENQLLTGFRLATSNHKQQLNSYSIRQLEHYWQEELNKTPTEAIVYDDLNAMWLEFLVGVKAELLKNMYVGLSVRMHYLLNEKEIDHFDNLYVPGFHKVSGVSPWGAGLNYSLMYQFPIFKK